jgi:hypothetical protein
VNATGYFVTGLLRPLLLLVFWLPLIAGVLYLVRRFIPQHERWLFYRLSWRALGRAIRRRQSRAASRGIR